MLARVTIGTNDTKIDTYQRVTASHADSSLTKPINRTTWTYHLQMHGITRLIVSPGRTPVVLQLLRFETSRRCNYLGKSSPASSRLRQADHCSPGSSLNSSPSSGEPLLSETPLSLLWMRCPRSTLVRGAPSRYRLRRLRLRSTAPRYRNSASVSLFISSRVVPVTCFVRIVYHELPYRDSCTHPVHDNFYRTSR